MAACHRFDHRALFRKWDPAFIAIGSSHIGCASTEEQTLFRAAGEVPKTVSDTDPAKGKFMPIDGCRPKALSDFHGRLHIMAISFPSASDAFIAFNNSGERDTFIQELQVSGHNHSCGLSQHSFSCQSQIMSLILFCKVKINGAIFVSQTAQIMNDTDPGV